MSEDKTTAKDVKEALKEVKQPKDYEAKLGKLKIATGARNKVEDAADALLTEVDAEVGDILKAMGHSSKEINIFHDTLADIAEAMHFV